MGKILQDDRLILSAFRTMQLANERRIRRPFPISNVEGGYHGDAAAIEA